jgi:hypothetical protein
VALALLLAPLLALGLLRRLGLADAATTASTLLGCAVAAGGGLLSGGIADRLLRRGQGEIVQVVGIGATVAVSVITVGAIYLGMMHNSPTTIGTAPRAIEQLLAFAQFLLAQASSVVFLARSEPRRRLAS